MRTRHDIDLSRRPRRWWVARRNRLNGHRRRGPRGVAVAEARLTLHPSMLDAMTAHPGTEKAFAAIRDAAVHAAQAVHGLLPRYTAATLGGVDVEFIADPALPGMRIYARVTAGRSHEGDMQALMAASVACLKFQEHVQASKGRSTLQGVRLVYDHAG